MVKKLIVASMAPPKPCRMYPSNACVLPEKKLPVTESFIEFLITGDVGKERRREIAKEAMKKNDKNPKMAPPTKSILFGIVMFKYFFLKKVRAEETKPKPSKATIKKAMASAIPLVKDNLSINTCASAW